MCQDVDDSKPCPVSAEIDRRHRIIEAYHYEPSGDAYNLFFEQFSDRFGTREFVMYNPRNQQAMTSHKMDRLQLSPQELVLEQTRGHYAVHDASQPHWKYFWFD